MLSGRIGRPCLTCRKLKLQIHGNNATLSTLGFSVLGLDAHGNKLPRASKPRRNANEVRRDSTNGQQQQNPKRNPFQEPEPVQKSRLDRTKPSGIKARSAKSIHSTDPFRPRPSSTGRTEPDSPYSRRQQFQQQARTARLASRRIGFGQVAAIPSFQDRPKQTADPWNKRQHDTGPSRPGERRTEDAENVPFESEKALQAVTAATSAANTTMTAREKAVFARLSRLQVAASPAHPQQQSIPSEQENAEDVNEDVTQSGPEPESTPATEPESVEQQNEITTTDPIQRDIDAVRGSLEAASTDLELWTTLVHEVYLRAIDLKLDKRTPIRHKQLLASLNITTRKKPTPTNEAIFSKSFPQHLTNFMEIVRRKFPASTYGLQVLPTLRELGSATFALGASTPLYNAHMFLLWTRYQDVDSIVSVLREMDRNVYLYDGGTQTLVNHVVGEVSNAVGGMYGDVVRRFCSASSAAQKRLFRMRKRVAKVREEEALREARVRESAGVDWEGEIEEVEGQEVMPIRRVGA